MDDLGQFLMTVALPAAVLVLACMVIALVWEVVDPRNRRIHPAPKPGKISPAEIKAAVKKVRERREAGDG